jgi:hypothetical protein
MYVKSAEPLPVIAPTMTSHANGRAIASLAAATIDKKNPAAIAASTVLIYDGCLPGLRFSFAMVVPAKVNDASRIKLDVFTVYLLSVTQEPDAV